MSEAAQTLEPVLDAASEAILEGVDDVVDVVEVVRNNPVALVAAGVVGLLAGAAGGYFLSKKLLQKKYEELANEEIAQAKEFYAGVYKVDSDGTTFTPQEVMAQRHGEEAVEALREYQGLRDEDVEVEPAGEPHDEVIDEAQIQKIEQALRDKQVDVDEKKPSRNVFVDPTFDLEEELKYRTEDKPYIITHDEYYEAAKDYDNHSLTYYQVDGVLCDEHDKPIENADEIVGEDHLVRFGSGSKDKNIVFVRNDVLETDYEIVRSRGSFLEEVLGMPNEEPGSLKHSDDRRRAFRRGDE